MENKVYIIYIIMHKNHTDVVSRKIFVESLSIEIVKNLLFHNIVIFYPIVFLLYFIFPVRPLKMDLNGVVGHVVKGTKILLQCTVRAARPAANITWQNGTQYLKNTDESDMFKTKVTENVSKSCNFAFTSVRDQAITFTLRSTNFFVIR